MQYSHRLQNTLLIYEILHYHYHVYSFERLLISYYKIALKNFRWTITVRMSLILLLVVSRIYHFPHGWWNIVGRWDCADCVMLTMITRRLTGQQSHLQQEDIDWSELEPGHTKQRLRLLLLSIHGRKIWYQIYLFIQFNWLKAKRDNLLYRSFDITFLCPDSSPLHSTNQTGKWRHVTIISHREIDR